MEENKDFLTAQLITYLGNKRRLLGYIEKEINCILNTPGRNKQKNERLVCADIFSGSGVVARLLKQYSKQLLVNDLENYSFVLNDCYLTNQSDFPEAAYWELHSLIEEGCRTKKTAGIITKNYAPAEDYNIQPGERVFYTHENALLIDTYRNLIEQLVPQKLQKFFLAPLITEASVHVNTSGVFKGFYKDRTTGIGCFGGKGKNALTRILGQVVLPRPVLSNFESEVQIFQQDAVDLACSGKLKDLDIAYLDPPYNQHPYGSNYFMLNLILKNRLDVEISRVSGITQGWNRSNFNRRAYALVDLEKIICALDSKFVIISYNSEGFINFDDMSQMLKKYGKLKTVEIAYNTFRGSRNLQNRDIHVKEYLFVLAKEA